MPALQRAARGIRATRRKPAHSVLASGLNYPSAMISVLRKHYWVVTATTVLLCGVFAASAVSSVLEAAYFSESETPAVAPALTAPTPPRVERDKDGSALAERNMFCSTCSAQVEPPAEPGRNASGEGIPVTSLPLELLATNVANRPDWSFVTIRNTASSQQGSYWVGDRLPGGGPIQLIGGGTVVFENPTTGRLERVALFADRPPEGNRVARSSEMGEPGSPFADQIRKIDDTTFEVQRSLVTQLLARPESIRGARVRPVQNPDESVGFRFYAVGRSSLPAALGLRSGDVVSAVNGMEFTSPDRLLEIYSKVRELDRLSVTITRGGSPITLAYDVI